MSFLRALILLLTVLFYSNCTAPVFVSNIEEKLINYNFLPLEYPILWSFNRILRSEGKNEVLDIDIEVFDRIFPFGDRKSNSISFNEDMLGNAIADLLILFHEKQLFSYRQNTVAKDNYLEYRLIYDGDTLIYTYAIDSIPNKVSEIDSILTKEYFSDLITFE